MTIWTILIFTVLVTLLESINCKRKMILLMEILNRGATSPYDLKYYKTVPDFAKKYGQSEMTSVGYRQHYLLGK